MKCKAVKCSSSLLLIIIGSLVVATNAAFSGRYERHNVVSAFRNHSSVDNHKLTDHKKTIFGFGSNRAPPAHDTPSGTCNCRKF